jgi:hypothetical protein
MEFVLIIYLLLTYAMGFAFMVMTISKDEMLTVGDLLMFILAPFTMVPILFVQLVSNLFDLDTVIYRK